MRTDGVLARLTNRRRATIVLVEDPRQQLPTERRSIVSRTRVVLTLALALAPLVLLPAACSDASLIVDTSPIRREPAEKPFPAITRPAALYRAPESLYGYPSRYVLYDDGSFALQFMSSFYEVPGVSEYTGRYTRSDVLLTLGFDRSNRFGAWEATGILRADELTVTYNTAMSLDDFVGGTYARVSSEP
jgi:hypothetical protein